MPAESYPDRYERRILLKNGKGVFFRPVLPSDKQLLHDLFDKMSPRSRYLRFMTNRQEIPEQLLHQFTHPDYDRNFTLVGLIEEDGNDAIIAVGQYAFDPDENIADLAVAVRDDWQHVGLGRSLLSNIIRIGKDHGINRFGSIMDLQNDIMRHTLRNLGYQLKYFSRDDSYLVEIVVE